MTAILIAALAIAVPAVAFTMWPLVRRGGTTGALAMSMDPREPLTEQKRTVLRALRELEFEHTAGHVSDDDYAELRARYESDAADILAELDRLGVATPEPAAGVVETPVRRSAWQHPVALAVTAAVLVVFGAALGVGIVRYTSPDQNAGGAMSGSRPLSDVASSPPPGGPPMGGSGPIPPAVMQRMLDAARSALFAGQYGDAIAAYQAILKRDPKNVDAITHLSLIVALGNHADAALQGFDKALAIDPNYPPAFLYRGQVLYEAKNDPAGAIRAWERYLTLVPSGEDHDRVVKLIADARAGRPPTATR